MLQFYYFIFEKQEGFIFLQGQKTTTEIKQQVQGGAMPSRGIRTPFISFSGQLRLLWNAGGNNSAKK